MRSKTGRDCKIVEQPVRVLVGNNALAVTLVKNLAQVAMLVAMVQENVK